jgi:serine/threonine-protein kinase
MTAATGQGQLLAGRYRLEGLVGYGGAGTVWRAMDLVLARTVAVKLLRPEVADDPLAAGRFLEEARSASRLSHPGIAQVHDYGVADPEDVPFLVMELVDGPSLAQVVAAGPLAPDRTVDVVAQVAAGLHAAHSAGVVHRDIKPGNLLTSLDGQVKITDFGIASVIGSAPVMSTGAILGTPAYLAPERATGASATPASDLYSLGVVAYECLTGTRPVSGHASEVGGADRGRPFPLLPASVPADLAMLVAELTAKEPSQRPRSALDVATRAAELRLGRTGQTSLAGAMWNWRSGAGPAAAEPTTLTEAVITPLPGEPGSDKQHVATASWRAPGVWLAIAAALVIVGLIGWQVGLVGASGSPGPAPRESASPPVRGIIVNSAALVGLPVGEVLADLRRLGLRPVLVPVATSDQPAGTVVSVQPGGSLAPGTTVTVVAAAASPQVIGNGGNGGGDGHDGGGSGDGGGGGSDGGGGH